MLGFSYLTPSANQAHVLSLLEHEAKKEAARLEDIASAWRYYRGEMPLALKVGMDEPDDNVIVNLVALAVDAGVDMLWGDDLRFRLGEEDEAEPSPEELYLDAVWERNQRMALLGDVGTNAAIGGHWFVKIQPIEGVAPRTEMPESLPRLINLDPSNVKAIWDQDDHDRVVEYRITWTVITEEGKPAARRQRVVLDGLAWQIIDEISRGADARWETLSEEPWPYPWPPVVDAKNLPAPNEFYGVPDVTDDLMRLNRSVNAVLSNARRVSRLHGHPTIWASGLSNESVLDVGPGEAIVLPDEDSRLGNLSPMAHLTGHLDLAARLKAAFHEQSRTPEIAAGKLENIGQLSGLALRILYGPLVRKVKVKRLLSGHGIDTLNRRLLELGGFEAQQTVIDWPEIVPSSESERAETAETKQRAGVSKATTLSELGYDPEQEMERRREERDTSLAEAMTAFDRGEDG